MAEINIERKQGKPFPWIIAGLAVLSFLLRFLFARDGGHEVTRRMAPGTLADSLADASYRDDTTRPLFADGIGLRFPDTTHVH